MAKIKRSILKDIRTAARNIKNQEAEENNGDPDINQKLTNDQKRQIKKEAFNDHKVKVTWNIHPGDLVKIKARVSPTGRELFGLVTWGTKETVQRGPSTGWSKNLKSYQNNVRVMSAAGYLFFPANSMIVLN